MNCCAILGQTPAYFQWGFDEEARGCLDLKLMLLQQIMVLRQQGVTRFLVAGDYGVGLYAAEQINVLKDADSALTLICVVPHEEQATKWAPYLRERYFDMLGNCNFIDCISLHAQPNAQLLAYQKIIDTADVILTVCDMKMLCGASTEEQAILYAIQQNKRILNIDPNDRTLDQGLGAVRFLFGEGLTD